MSQHARSLIYELRELWKQEDATTEKNLLTFIHYLSYEKMTERFLQKWPEWKLVKLSLEGEFISWQRDQTTTANRLATAKNIGCIAIEVIPSLKWLALGAKAFCLSDDIAQILFSNLYDEILVARQSAATQVAFSDPLSEEFLRDFLQYQEMTPDRQMALENQLLLRVGTL